ncbi:LacI family DNA-binding transcriptional regulator [Agrococcus jejuensis]|uniref:Transcriptional regulator, LacI family n=1 Tax=Agrococcus jejuensis TaxID=399736 RepID=A0A1G8E856_9MICO|nr:LacI family DNA-binding transcriptional regulator [Agrococcus jejuensis]SDH65809.1 transcriptional regulator, LacI family [Agrococcus jejuensis]
MTTTHDDVARTPAPRAGHRVPTLVDVAEAAGVSIKTASRALNGEPNVADATRGRVRAAASTLGFTLNSAASQLRRGTAVRTVGLVVGDLANPFYMGLATGVEHALREHGLQLTMASSDEDAATEHAIVEDLVHRRATGILLVSTLDEHGELRSVGDRGVPLVLVDRAPSGIEADAVVIDNVAGTTAAIAGFVARGHRRIAFVGDLERLSPQRERYAAYAAALAAAGLPLDPALVVRGSHSAVAAEGAVRDLLALDEPPTAVFTANNRVTIGAIGAFRDVAHPPALVGFDHFELADALGITTVGADTAALGREAVAALLRRGDGEHVPATRALPATLVARGSGERAPA